jgi:hypothetical protein
VTDLKKGEKKRVECLFKEIRAENIPYLKKDINIPVQEEQRSPIRFSPHKTISRHYNQTIKNQSQRYTKHQKKSKK